MQSCVIYGSKMNCTKYYVYPLKVLPDSDQLILLQLTVACLSYSLDQHGLQCHLEKNNCLIQIFAIFTHSTFNLLGSEKDVNFIFINCTTWIYHKLSSLLPSAKPYQLSFELLSGMCHSLLDFFFEIKRNWQKED